MLSQSVQVVFAICLIIIFLIIGISIYNYEYLKTFNIPVIKEPARKKVPIFEGIKDASISNQEKYVTVRDFSSDKPLIGFRDINSSKEQRGGIEFTYTFWLYVAEDTDRTSSAISAVQYKPDEGLTKANIAQQTILFVKGSDKLSTYNNLCNETKLDYMVKCPLVKLERNNSQLTVEFNTVPSKADGSEYIEGIKEKSKNQCNDYTSNWKESNAHKITLGNIDRPELTNRWILVSIILKDTSPKDYLPVRNKARCMIYINNFLELDTYVDGTLQHMKNNLTTLNINKGPLHVFPLGKISNVTTHQNTNQQKLMMGDLTHYNYSLESDEIVSIFDKGPPNYVAPAIAKTEIVDFSIDIANRANFRQTTSP